MVSGLFCLAAVACSSSTESAPEIAAQVAPETATNPAVTTPSAETKTGNSTTPTPEDIRHAEEEEATATGPLTTIRVHYPALCMHITMRGAPASDPSGTVPLSWSTDAATTAEDATTFVYRTKRIAAASEVKPLCDGKWSLGPNFKVAPGGSVDIYPRFTTAKGVVEKKWASFTSTALPSTRAIFVYYPPTYLENDLARMDVLYMHDAQNLFTASTSFGGVEWQVDETMDRGAENGSIRETLIVGIENTPDRIAELTPTPGSRGGGKGDAYLTMLSAEIKPMVDGALRTNPAREQTGIMGSSLGGLISMHAAVAFGDTFGLIGIMSPSTWWDSREIIDEVNAWPAGAAKPTRLYLDHGQSGDSGDDSANTRDLASALHAAGLALGTTMKYVVEPGGEHNETSWSRRLPAALPFLLGPGR